ncbi:hypothetical protein AB0M12_40285 [Nocardia vinacea]|uniref:hypothetical protein n=1 Tax=Nocardia vinacea TaxID=96468 RepID=UPI00343122A8
MATSAARANSGEDQAVTTVDEAPDNSRQEFDWGLAPSHLKTRRQLRAMGKSPGQSFVGHMVGKFRGRRVAAQLFDSRRAPDKRVPSQAQLAAIRKATAEHQIRAAERRGITRDQLNQEFDPGPGWTDPTTYHQEENPMSNIHPDEIRDYAQHLDQTLSAALRNAPVYIENATPEYEAEAAKSAEAVVRAQEQLEEHLRRHRDILGREPQYRPYYESYDRVAEADEIAERIYDEVAAAQQTELGVPTGHGQRVAYLLAVVAVNQARHRDEKLAAAVETAQAAGGDALDELVRKSQDGQARAESRLESTPKNNQAATVAALADALVWHRNSDIAAGHLADLTRSYAEQWGVTIDADQFSVGIDPDFDAVDAQDHAEAWRLWERESAVLDIVSAMPLPDAAKGAVSEAISAWRGIGISPVDPRAHLRDEATRREQLGIDLAAAQVPDADQARVEFVVDYLRGNLEQVDLLDSPVFLDPGEEARGRVPRLLAAFADNPKAAAWVTAEIAVMTAADQERVRQAGRDIAAGREVDFAVWPGHVDRYDLAEDLTNYAAEYGELHATAEYLAKGGMSDEERDRLGVDFGSVTDDVNVQITRIAEQREQLRTQILDGKGLASMERAQLLAVIDDIDAGRIENHTQLPELLFADERSKADADVDRISKPAAQLSTATREAITQRIEAAGVEVSHRTWEGARLQSAASSLGDSIYSVACGARGDGVEYERKSYADKRARLGQALVKAGVDESVRTEIRELIDDRARQAGVLGTAAAQREQRWQAKTDRVVAARDNAIAQRLAATAGRAPQSSRACTTNRPDRAAQTASPAPARVAGRRNLHSAEVGR